MRKLSVLAVLMASAFTGFTAPANQDLKSRVDYLIETMPKVEALQQRILEINGQIDAQGQKIKTLESTIAKLRQEQAARDAAREAAASTVAKTIRQTSQAASKANQAAKSKQALIAQPQQSDATQTAQAESQAAVAKARAEYEAAYALVRENDYDAALKAFTAFVEAHPKSVHAIGAHYWLGELYLIDKQPKQAIAEFQWVLTAGQKTAYAPEAAFKLGLIYQKAGDKANMNRMLSVLKARYPRAKVTGIATAKLKLG